MKHFPHSANHRAAPLRVVPRPVEATSSPSPQEPYSEAVSVELRRIIILALILFWLIVGIVWWAA